MKPLLAGVAGLAWLAPLPVLGQDHAGHPMPHQVPAPAPAPRPTAAPTPAAAAPTATPKPAPSPAPIATDPSAMDRSAMDHGAMAHSPLAAGDQHESGYGGATPMGGEGSGTARLPAAESASHGLHVDLGGNTALMLHGMLWGVYTDQTGPRGDNKLTVQSMAMATVENRFDGGRIVGRAMMSLEPAMRHDGYPNLFATGEVAYGRPLVDRQHPHDLFMELAARVDLDIAPGTTLFLYGGPVGEPALGPSAFMHRASARYNPEAPITHHWFDSTHISYGVVTTGVAARRFQLEASAFRGREPDEHRWNIETPKLDSWSVRASFAPSDRWLLQASYGELNEPEELHPGEDEHRATASAHYNNGKGFSATAALSAKNRQPGETLTAWLGEANWDLDRHHTLFGRVENVANDELFPDHADPLHDRTFRITKLQAGYAYRVPLGAMSLALGGTAAAFLKPDALDPFYGSHPMGYTVFARLSLGV